MAQVTPIKNKIDEKLDFSKHWEKQHMFCVVLSKFQQSQMNAP